MNPKLEKLNITKIITHPGSCHMDDLIAVSICAYLFPKAIIERKDPTQQELESKHILIIDVGKQYNPNLLNFDHHQWEINREEPDANKCALDLIWEFIGYGEEEKIHTPWVDTTSIIDCLGIKFGSNWFGMLNTTTLAGFIQNPFYQFFSKRFQHTTYLNPKTSKDSDLELIKDIQTLGESIILNIENTKLKLSEIQKHAKFEKHGNTWVLKCLDYSAGSLLNTWLRIKRQSKNHNIRAEIRVVKIEKRKEGIGFFDENGGRGTIDLTRIKKYLIDTYDEKTLKDIKIFLHNAKHILTISNTIKLDIDKLIEIAIKPEYKN